MVYTETPIWPLYKHDLDTPLDVPENSEIITKSLEKITANPKIWFNRSLFRDHYKNLRLADLSLKDIHVFGKKVLCFDNMKNVFGYVVEVISIGKGPFYVNLTQRYVDEYILPGEVKITKGGRTNRNFVRPTAI